MSDAATDRALITDVAIDAHYYDGGLKVARLAGGTVQPPWVPADATDQVGLHEAFSLQPGDRAVEISRLRSGPHAVTWIAVYRRSQDASYGDRDNYAGVGVWLLNQVVHGPVFLLDGLDTLSRTLLDGGLDAAQAVAGQFLARDNLPGRLAPLMSMPSGLGGWTFSQDLLPVKELYEVTVAEGERVAWQPVAEHILRMTLLPAPTAAHARSLILVRPTSNAGVGPLPGLKPLPVGLATELAKALPAALAEQQLSMATLLRDHEDVTRQLDRLRHELATAQAVQTNQALHITDLERQLDASDTDGRFKAMGGTLARIDEQVRGNGLALEQVAQTVRRIELKTGQTAGMGSVQVGGTRTAGPSSDLAGWVGAPSSSGTNQNPAQLQRSAKSYEFGLGPDRYFYRWVLGGIAALVMIAIGYLIYRTMRPDPTPSVSDRVPIAMPREDQSTYGAGYENRSFGENLDKQGYGAGERNQDYEADQNGSYSSADQR